MPKANGYLVWHSTAVRNDTTAAKDSMPLIRNGVTLPLLVAACHLLGMAGQHHLGTRCHCSNDSSCGGLRAVVLPITKLSIVREVAGSAGTQPKPQGKITENSAKALLATENISRFNVYTVFRKTWLVAVPSVIR